MNYIHLAENFYFCADREQYILVKKKIAENEEPVFKNTGYYSSVEALLQGVVRHGNRDMVEAGELTTLEDCIKHLTELYSTGHTEIIRYLKNETVQEPEEAETP